MRRRSFTVRSSTSMAMPSSRRRSATATGRSGATTASSIPHLPSARTTTSRSASSSDMPCSMRSNTPSSSLVISSAPAGPSRSGSLQRAGHEPCSSRANRNASTTSSGTSCQAPGSGSCRRRAGSSSLRGNKPMAKSEATNVDAGERDLRVSSPDRVIFPETERTPPSRSSMSSSTTSPSRTASCARSTGGRRQLERWPKGVHPGIVLSTREGRRRRLLPEAHPARGAGLRGDGADRVQSGRHADEICPTEIAVNGLGGPDGHDHVPSVADFAARTSTIRTSCGSTWTPSRARTSTTPCAWPPSARSPGRPRLCRLPGRRAAASTSTSDRAALDLHRRPSRRDRPRARARRRLRAR